MAKIVRWNPYREMIGMLNSMDRLVDGEALPHRAHRARPTNWGLALDVAEDENAYFLKASLPGINPEAIDITYEKNVLTIKGAVEADDEVEERRYHMRERRYGSFCRSVNLPATVDAKNIDATYKAGVLTLELPKMEDAKPKRIEVKSINAENLIEG